MDLTVKHVVSEQYRQDQAKLGIAIPRETKTTFESVEQRPEWPDLLGRSVFWQDHDGQVRATDGTTWHRYKVCACNPLQYNDWGCWQVLGEVVPLTSATETLTWAELLAGAYLNQHPDLPPEQVADNERSRSEHYADQRRLSEAEEARKTAQAEERETARTELQLWAEEYGSDLLLARVEGNYEWEALAAQELMDSILAGAGLLDSVIAALSDDTIEDRTTPSLDEIQALRIVRRALGETATAELVWVTVASEDHYEEEQHYAAIRVTTPGRYSRTRYLQSRRPE